MEKKEKSRVILLPCRTYDGEEIYRLLCEGVRLLGGIRSLIKEEEKILLKPNLVRKAEVERAVITHPEVMGAVARLLREEGYQNIICGDSCGIGSAEKTMEGTGMDRLMEKYEIPVDDFSHSIRTFCSGKQFVLAKEAYLADAIINVCKMKTHALERVTGAVKNMYGCVCGLNKAKGHTLYPNAESFARMLAELNAILRPRLHIMDGITAMDGNGPTSGDPVDMGLLLMSTDPIALDAVFCNLIYLDPKLVPTNVYGMRRGLGTFRTGEIELYTPDGKLSMEEAVRRYGNPDYRVDRRRYRKNIWNALNVLKIFRKKPYIVEEKCRRCGICVESCPVEDKAVTFQNGRAEIPVYDYHKCIRCFCCQEMCPHKAIEVK